MESVGNPSDMVIGGCRRFANRRFDLVGIEVGRRWRAAEKVRVVRAGALRLRRSSACVETIHCMRKSKSTLLCASIVCVALLQSAGAASAERTLYITSLSPDAGVSAAQVDVETGVLTPITSSPVAAGATPTTPGITPDGSFLYVGDFWADQLHGFSLASGLTALAGFPVSTGAGPNAAVIKPDGTAVWTANYNAGTISGFDIAPDGSVSASANSPFTASGTPTTLAASPANNFVYSPAYAVDEVAGFESSPTDGELLTLINSPFTTGTTPTDAEFSVDGETLFVMNQGDDTISSYAIDCACGDLDPIATISTVDVPNALAASPDGRFLAVAGGADNVIAVYSISPFGQLTPNGNATPTDGSNPYDIVFSPNSRFIYTTNFNSGDVSAYEVSDTGTLSQVSGSPFSFFSAPAFSLAISPNQGPIAAATTSINNTLVNFDASTSSDPDGNVADYHWEFGDGVNVTTNSPQISHNYASAGTYGVTLTVRDNEGCTKYKIGTGQTINCNGSSAAELAFSVATSIPTPTPAPDPTPTVPPISLTDQTVKQLRGTPPARRRAFASRPVALGRRRFRFAACVEVAW